MKLIDFIFKLIMSVTPINSVDYGNLRKEADDWYNNISTDDENVNPKLKQIKKHAELWYIQILLALMFPFLKRSFYLYANPEMELVNKDEED